MKRIGILTSGGDCQGLNASIRGVAKSLYEEFGNDVEIYGIKDGYKGLIFGEYKLMKPEDFSGILTLGGTILGTSRQPFKLMRVIDENSVDKVQNMKDNYKKMKLDCLVILGGNGTQKTANLLREEGLNVVSLPKTIDNDLVLTDHTPGFGSAAKYVASTVREIVLDASVYQQRSVTIVEIMGRHAGWLTAASRLARKYEGDNPCLIYLPETPFSLEQFYNDLDAAFKKSPNLVVCVSEGIADEGGTFVCEYSDAAKLDSFGHKMLTGSGKYLENLVKERLGIKVRSVELNVSQRCSSACLSAADLDEAVCAGTYGVQAALLGETGKMVSFQRTNDNPYKLTYTTADVNNICNKEKGVPLSWITNDGSDISEDFIRYALPLIQGNVEVPFENGLPAFAFRR